MKTFKILSVIFSLIVGAFIGSAIGVNAELSQFGTNVLTGCVSLASGLTCFIPMAQGAMLTACGAITANIAAVCTDTNIPGAKNRVILINYDHLFGTGASITKNSSNKLIIEAITLATASPANVAYEISGNNLKVKGVCTPVEIGNGVAYTNTVGIMLGDNTPAIKKQLNDGTKGLFVLVVENLYNNENAVATPGDSVFEVYGLTSGLRLMPTKDINNTEIGNGWDLQFSTPKDQYEKDVVATIFKTDYATSKAIVDGLLV